MNVNGNPVAMKILPDMYEVVTGLARTDQLVGIPLIDVNLNLDTFYSKHLKRIMDIIISFSLLSSKLYHNGGKWILKTQGFL